MISDLIKSTHPQWHSLLTESLSRISPAYWQELAACRQWLPGFANMLAAFSLPVDKTRYILLGESPYPRAASANGYAFWDAAVQELWAPKGLATAVNRATSLRNFIKMLLHARGDLVDDFSQPAIARLDKSAYWQTAPELFGNMVKQGFLLLNASLVFRPGKVPYDSRAWQPFVENLCEQLAERRPDLTLLLFGRIAEKATTLADVPYLIAEHPYNLGFITNPKVLHFFKPLDLLTAYE